MDVAQNVPRENVFMVPSVMPGMSLLLQVGLLLLLLNSEEREKVFAILVGSPHALRLGWQQAGWECHLGRFKAGG